MQTSHLTNSKKCHSKNRHFFDLLASKPVRLKNNKHTRPKKSDFLFRPFAYSLFRSFPHRLRFAPAILQTATKLNATERKKKPSFLFLLEKTKLARKKTGVPPAFFRAVGTIVPTDMSKKENCEPAEHYSLFFP